MIFAIKGNQPFWRLKHLAGWSRRETYQQTIEAAGGIDVSRTQQAKRLQDASSRLRELATDLNLDEKRCSR